MATLPQRREVKLGSTVKCPVCEADVPVVTLVDVIGGSAQKSGQAGFRKPVVIVNLETNIIGFKFEHECQYDGPYGDD
jgi:hypothetical protein